MVIKKVLFSQCRKFTAAEIEPKTIRYRLIITINITKRIYFKIMNVILLILLKPIRFRIETTISLIEFQSSLR